MLNQIAAQVVSDGCDAIIPIATLAATCSANATGDIPIIYAAISDPVGADLTGIDNVTGTSDALNTPFILDMMLAVNPDVKSVGLLYSNSELNSLTPIAETKAYLDAKGIRYVDKTGNTNDEILSAVSSMLDQVDAVFTPTDNAVMGFSANVTLLKTATIFTAAQELLGKSSPYKLIVPAVISVTVCALLILFLGTRLGLSIRATGDNPDMVFFPTYTPPEK